MTLTMKKFGSFFSALFLLMLMAVHVDADARRMGGGSSVGRQSNHVSQGQSATPASQNANRQQQGAANNANAANTRPRSPMAGILGGLAAGLGLAWLANALGFGEEFGNIMLMILLGMIVMAAVGFFMRSRNRMAAQGAGFSSGFKATNGLGDGGQTSYRQAAAYNPQNVGNDASARPFDQQDYAATAQSSGGSMIGSSLAPNQGWGVPEGFDTQGFLNAAKHHFVSLQKSWDNADLIGLRALMTDEMLAEIRQQLDNRHAYNNGAANHTEVVSLDARLLGIEELLNEYVASVEFSGLIQEDPAEGPKQFTEVWNLSKPVQGGGWLVAGIQALQ